MADHNGERTLHEWLRHIDTKLDEHRISVERKLTIIDAKLDKKAASDETKSNRARIAKLEEFANKAKGIAALISLVGGVLAGVFLMGCATTHTRCVYQDGDLRYTSTRATVIGTGHVDVLVETCGDATFETDGTGISDNGTEAISKVAEGVAAGVVKGVTP